MRFTMLCRLWPVVTLLAVSTTLWSRPAVGDTTNDEGFTELFNGTDLTGWKTFLDPKTKDADPRQTWTVKDGIIHCTGQPLGFFYTEKDYQNYVFRYDWRYERPENLTDDSKFLGNSGCLVHIHNPEHPVVGGVWPQCIEVQGMNRDHGRLLFLKCDGKGKFDMEAKNRATHPVGQWNTTEITCAAHGSIEAKINGTPVSSGSSNLKEGKIGFQSEGAVIEFRNIKIKEVKWPNQPIRPRFRASW